MEARARSITFLGDEGAVRIPFFQRAYVWTKSNWEDMLTDLLEFDKSRFLGSLILKQQPPRTGEQKEVLVIDGQQRLTTISILLKALYDSFSEELKANCRNELLKYLFYKRHATDKNYQIRIIHSRLDARYFKKVIGEVDGDALSTLTESELNSIDEKSSKILQCYKYFRTQLQLEQEETRARLFNKLLEKDNKIIVLIDLSDSDEEQSIFDTINSAGVRLSGTDIVKNAIFQRAIDLLDIEKATQLHDEYWDRVFSGDEDAQTFWTAKKATGRLMRDNSEILLQSIAVIKGIFDPDEHILSDLPDLYKKHIVTLKADGILPFIKEIHEYASTYRDTIPDFDESALFSYHENRKRLFHILDACEISTFHPYIMFLIRKYKQNSDLLDERLLSLESLVVKRMIAGFETKSYNKPCKEFISNENVDDKIASIGDDDVSTGLERISNKNASLLLFWIELFRRYKDSKQSVRELKFDYSLEHLMPQKWEDHWSSVPILDDGGKIIENPENAKAHRNKRIYSIGNMTLLNSRLNTSLRNFAFDRKIEGAGRMKGIRQYSELWITKDDIISRYDSGNKTWDEKSIFDRTRALGQEILKIWNRPCAPNHRLHMDAAALRR